MCKGIKLLNSYTMKTLIDINLVFKEKIMVYVFN